MLREADVHAIVDGVLARGLGPAFSRAAIRYGENFEGRRSLYVKAFLKPDRPRPESRQSLDLMIALRHALEAAGEEREPYLDLDYPADANT